MKTNETPQNGKLKKTLPNFTRLQNNQRIAGLQGN
jgi:hypothetical protein